MPEVELAGAEHRQLIDHGKGVGPRHPEVGQALGTHRCDHAADLPLGRQVKHDQPLPLGPIRHGRHHREQLPIGRPERLVDRLLDREMGHHLAADLRKPALAAGDRDEALAVEPGDVAGAVPAVVNNLLREIRPVEIALHHVGPRDPQHPLFADGQLAVSLPFGDPRAATGDRLAHRALAGIDRPARHMPGWWHIRRHERGEFCRPVGLDGPDTKLLLEGIADFLGQLLSSPEDRLEGREILGRRSPHVDPKKGGRGHQDRGVILAGQPAHDLGVSRIGVVDDRRIEHQRCPERGRVAVGVEEGQHAEGHVGRREVEQLVDRTHVGADVLLAQHHPLGVARRARGEDHREHVVGPQPMEPQQPLQERQRHNRRLEEAHELVGRGGELLETTGVEQLLTHVEVHTREKQRARDNMLKPGSLDADVEDRLGRGVVEVYRHAAGEGQGRVHDRPAGRGRQEHAHPLLVGAEHPVEHPFGDEDPG